MIERTKDGWRKPRSIYRSFLGSGALTVGVIAIVCLVVVLVCHLFETPTPEVNALRYTYAHAGIIVAIALLVNVIEPICQGLIMKSRVQYVKRIRNYFRKRILRATSWWTSQVTGIAWGFASHLT